MDVVVRCENLTRRFGDRVAVDALSRTIAAGETYGRLGPNGGGRTTTIRMGDMTALVRARLTVRIVRRSS